MNVSNRLARVFVLTGLLAGLSAGACWPGGSGLEGTLLPGTTAFSLDDTTLLVRLAQISDTHVVDAASPGRLAQFDCLVGAAWRPQEAYAAQILDGTIRAINQYHEDVGKIDLLIHTGDAVDNAQKNEYEWFLAVMDGEVVDTCSCEDDRAAEDIPATLLDPYQPFQAEGVYTRGQHGSLATIPWYAVVGNHDVYASGNFAIVQSLSGRWISPLPLYHRPGILLPTILIPDGGFTYGPVSPANPGPPATLSLPVPVVADSGRAFQRRSDILAACFASATEPLGHGFPSADGTNTWYSTIVATGVRLITLDTTDVPSPAYTIPYAEGSISSSQLAWFEGQLSEASTAGEWVIVASHHPSDSLLPLYGTAIAPDGFRTLLNQYDNVVLHLAGHSHVNRVMDWGGYVEIETASTLDYPQTGRIVEVHQTASDEIVIQYKPVSHQDSADSLSDLRDAALSLALKDAGRIAKKMHEKTAAPSPDDPAPESPLRGSWTDPHGRVRLVKHPLTVTPTEE